MKPVYQTRTGGAGNCLAACFASILEVELAAIDFSCLEHGPNWYEVACEKLAQFDVLYVDLKIAPADHEGKIGIILPPETVFIASGPTKRGALLHSVLYRSDRTGARFREIHDPHPSGDGILRIEHVGLLLPNIGPIENYVRAQRGPG